MYKWVLFLFLMYFAAHAYSRPNPSIECYGAHTHKMRCSFAGCNKYIRTKKNVINNDRLDNFYSVYPAINKIYLILERYMVLNLNIIRTELFYFQDRICSVLNWSWVIVFLWKIIYNTWYSWLKYGLKYLLNTQ